jgi:uncharacterized protein YebE (UPF0316 family)
MELKSQALFLCPPENMEEKFMTYETIVTLTALFLITSFTNVLATLKTIMISKKIMNPVYIIVFADAIIFASIMTRVVNGGGLYFTLAYALGRTFGVFLGGIIDERLALGIIEVDLFVSDKNKMIPIAEHLRKVGYSVNNYAVRGMNGEKRHKIEIVLKRKELKNIKTIIAEYGITDPTLKIKTINNISGKITTSGM